MKKGLFITFEGGEGAGKTTQVALLAEALKKAGREVVHTREPGGTEASEAIRALLVKGDVKRMRPETEVLLHIAARNEHVEQLIKPSLAAGKIVLCDRFFDSTMVYQGYGHGLPHAWIAMIQRLVIGTFMPDMTFVLLLDQAIGMARAGKRDTDENRYERMGTAFHANIHAGFHALVEDAPGRCIQVDAAKPVESVHEAILAHVTSRLETCVCV